MDERYLDELILRERRKRDNVRFVEDIMENGLPEELFQVVNIGNGIAEMKIPSLLEKMSQELIERKYAFDPQPQVIMTNRAGTVNWTISVLDAIILESELQENVSAVKNGLHRFSPTVIFGEEVFEKVDNIAICWFSYVINTLDGKKIYSIHCYAAAKKVILFTMSCDYAIRKGWEAIAKYCMQTLKGKVNSGQE